MLLVRVDLYDSVIMCTNSYELANFYLFALTCVPIGEVVGEELWAVVGAGIGVNCCG